MSKEIMDVIVSWGPMIILIVVWLYFMKKSGSTGYYTNIEKSLAELKLMNQKIDKIIAIIEKDKGKKY